MRLLEWWTYFIERIKKAEKLNDDENEKKEKEDKLGKIRDESLEEGWIKSIKCYGKLTCAFIYWEKSK